MPDLLDENMPKPYCRASFGAPRAALLLIALPALSACTEVEQEEGVVIRQISQEIRGGTIDETHTSVVGIMNRTQGGACTGTLIAPNLVLTAQHCVASTPLPYVICGRSQFGATHAPSSFRVTTRTNLFTFDGFYDVREVAVPPNIQDLCGGDIAVLILDENIPDTETIPYVPRIDITAERGERYSAHGYGVTGGNYGAGTRRWITGREVICDGPECRRLAGDQITDTEWVGTEGTCQGDSGGPALDNDLRVFGVLSRGGDGCSSSVYSAVDDHGEWIRQQGERAAELGGYYPAPWVTTGSSDVSIRDDDADGVPDEFDNCLDNANPSQEDVDGDGLGDACDPIDNRDRGGACDICNGCNSDDDCPGGSCVNFGQGGVCSADCEVNSDCPASTACFEIPGGADGARSLCLNDDASTGGVCYDDWVCGGEIVDPPSDGCDICRPCSDDRHCGFALCLDFGQGGVCTAECTDSDCPGDSICFDVDGRSVCLNPDAAEGVCNESYACDEAPALRDDDAGLGASTTSPPPAAAAQTRSGGGCSSAGGGRGHRWSALLLLLGLVSARSRGRIEPAPRQRP